MNNNNNSTKDLRMDKQEYQALVDFLFDININNVVQLRHEAGRLLKPLGEYSEEIVKTLKKDLGI